VDRLPGNPAARAVSPKALPVRAPAASHVSSWGIHAANRDRTRGGGGPGGVGWAQYARTVARCTPSSRAMALTVAPWV